MRLALLLSAVTASALIGTRFTPAPGTEIGDWYRSLEKSPLNPPPAVFGPVWTTLYTLMAKCARCDAEYAPLMQINDLIDVERQLGYRYEVSGALHYQQICPSCRRSMLAIAQGELWK